MINSFNEEQFTIPIDDRYIYGVIHHVESPCAIVVSAHGLNGERVDAHRILVQFSRKCVSENIVSVRFDFCGCGMSDEEFWHSKIESRVLELTKVVEYIRQIYKDIPIICHGFSDGSRIVYDGFEAIKPDACVFWSPIVLPSRAEDADMEVVSWQKIEGEKGLVKPFLGLWLGFAYVREYGKIKKNIYKDATAAVFCGQLDRTVDDSIEFLLEAFGAQKYSIQKCGHIYETRQGTIQVIDETIKWIRERVIKVNGKAIVY